MHYNLSRKQLIEDKKIHGNGSHQTFYIEENLKRISDIEKARWFTISRNKKRIRALWNIPGEKMKKVIERGFKSFFAKKDGKDVRFEISIDNRYGLTVSWSWFNIEEKFKFTDYCDVQQDIADEYFEYERVSRFLWEKNGRINQYFFDAIRKKWSNEWYSNGIEKVILNINNRTYVLTSRDGFKPIICPEETDYSLVVINYKGD